MTTTAQSILHQVQENLSDVDGTHWPATELLGYLNDCQREIAVARPDKFIAVTAHALVVGARQALPATCMDLIEIPRNTAGAVVRLVDKSLHDAVNGSWPTSTGSTTIKEVMYDLRDPNSFWVYPPAALGASVDVIHSTLPADVSLSGVGAAYTTVSGNVTVPDIFKTALLHGVLFKAFAKDADAGNPALSAAHKGLYDAAVSAELAPKMAVKPTTK
jgi:hypothetical protein